MEIKEAIRFCVDSKRFVCQRMMEVLLTPQQEARRKGESHQDRNRDSQGYRPGYDNQGNRREAFLQFPYREYPPEEYLQKARCEQRARSNKVCTSRRTGRFCGILHLEEIHHITNLLYMKQRRTSLKDLVDKLGVEKIYKEVVPMILKIRESSEKNTMKLIRRNLFRCILMLVCWMLSIVSASAFGTYGSMEFNRLTNRDGLSNTQVNAITERQSWLCMVGNPVRTQPLRRLPHEDLLLRCQQSPFHSQQSGR